MTQYNTKLRNEISTIVSMLLPDVDDTKLSLRLEEVLTNYNIDHKTADEKKSDIKDNIQLFLGAKKLEGYSQNTIEDYTIELSLFSMYCNKAVSQITTPDIRSYLASLDNIMASTIGKKLSVLKSFFGWLVSEEVVLRNPTVKIKSPKTPKRMPKSLTIEELEIIRDSCCTARERALVEMLYSTGMRVSELTNMKVKDINKQALSAKVIGKGDKEGVVYISVRAMYYLNKYLDLRDDDHESLFVSERKPIRSMSPRSVQNEIKKIRLRAGIEKIVTPHRFRHTLACMLINNNATLSDVQQILRHENPSTTLIYAHASEKKTQEAHRRHHVI